ncbi:hypothetical protein [Nostoc sp. 'Peltigera malacea cyanobiont' DB3992]|uniref:hypothetical protein n=1 Tax=Nostoc sp. 'Peltigera malacea cyanobiont' DB3992 TaxID=1206980 RepID=UPI0015D4E822|nr:hypothetical protein [Nostoc sp. 'Peltigera malacea cyanobiont' DB3992]
MPTQKTRNYLRYVNDGKEEAMNQEEDAMNQEEDAMNQEEDAMNRVSTRGDRTCRSFP